MSDIVSAAHLSRPTLSASTGVDRFSYDNAIVQRFAVATAAWGIIAFLAGITVALKLIFPDLLGGIGPLSYGRLRPLHTNAAIFAFAGNAISPNR